MAAGDYRIGLDGIFNSGAAGSTAATERDNVDDVNLNLSKRVAEAVRRGKTWVAIKPTVTEATLEFTVFDIDSDAFVAVLRAAFLADTRVALYPKDAATGEGLDADWYITQFSRAEDNEDFIKYSVQARPTDEERDPAWL
jgi:hypothetical protein